MRIGDKNMKITDKQINNQFGGGCPICKGNGTLTTIGGTAFKRSVECSACGSKFESHAGLTSPTWELVEGGGEYTGKKMASNDWNKIRKDMIGNIDAKNIEEYLTEGETILAECKSAGTSVTFYATDKRIIRVAGKDISQLDYSKKTLLSEAKERLGIIASGVGTFFMGLVLAAVIGAGFVPAPGIMRWLPVLFFLGGIAGIIMGIIGIKYYQFESPKLSMLEKGQWNIKGADDKSVKNFVAVVRGRLGTSATVDKAISKENPIETLEHAPEVSIEDDSADDEIIYSEDSTSRDLGILLANGIFPGLGTIIHGERKRGKIQLTLFISGLVTAIFLIGLLILLVVWVWALIDGVYFILDKELIFKNIGGVAEEPANNEVERT